MSEPLVEQPKPGARAWMTRFGGAVIGFLVAAINLIAVIANVDQIRQFVWGRLGLFGSENVYFSSVALVVGALVIYAFGVGAVYFFLIRHRRRLFVISYVSLVAAAAPVIAYFTFVEFSPAPAHAKVDQQVAQLEQTTIDQWAATGPDRGAFRFSLTFSTDAPQAWTSAQALAGLLSAPHALSSEHATMARHTINYLNAVRTSDGWGYQDGAAHGVTEIAGWVVIAEVMSLNPSHIDQIWPDGRDAEIDRVFDHLRYLTRRQHDDGGWGPNSKTANPLHERTYSTLIALIALLEAQRQPILTDDERWKYDSNIRRGVQWLLAHMQTSNQGVLGWYPNQTVQRQTGECLGLTAQGVYVLELARGRSGIEVDDDFRRVRTAFLDQALNGVRNLAGAENVSTRDLAVRSNCHAHDSDIYLPGVDFTLESSTFLWYPWSLAAAGAMQADPTLSDAERNMTRTLSLLLAQRIQDATEAARNDQVLYVAAETLYGANISSRARASPPRAASPTSAAPSQ